MPIVRHEHHHFFHFPTEPEAAPPAPPTLANVLAVIEEYMTQFSDSIGALQSEVANETQVEASAIALISGFSARLDAAVSAATDAGADPATLTELSALSDQIKTSSTQLAAAVTANTPAAQPAPVAASISISPTSLAGGQVNEGYSASLSASGGAAPYNYEVTAGLLPDGLSLDAGGNLTGTPTSAVVATFTVTATDANGATGQAGYSLTVDADPNAA